MDIVTLPKEKSKKLAERIRALKDEAALKMWDNRPNPHAWYYGYVNKGLEDLVNQLEAGGFFIS